MAFTSEAPVRRAQLITPFGVGALITNQSGVSMICAALDHWYGGQNVEQTEFEMREDWRLINRLNVDHVRRPPDYRERCEEDLNCGLTVPAFRFPRWHVCSRSKCGRMKEVSLSTRGKVYCDHCEGYGRRPGREMYQVRFVAVCDHGHIQDFPWREWVHRKPDPDCQGELRMQSYGGGALSSIYVECKECDKERRSLSRITVAHSERDTTHLTEQLSKEGDYRCRGRSPWTGTEEESECGRPLRGSLRNASNIYFGETISSLYLPPGDDEDFQDVVEKIKNQPRFAPALTMVEADPKGIGELIHTVRRAGDESFRDLSDERLTRAVKIAATGEEDSEDDETDQRDEWDEDEETAYRRAEFNTLRHSRSGPRLTIREEDMGEYRESMGRFFSRIMLIDRLKETRVLTGFTRLLPGGGEEVDFSQKRGMLWQNEPYPFGKRGWLPATEVHGEGIFLELNEDTLREWEVREAVLERTAGLQHRFTRSRYFEPGRSISPRLVLVHTFAHLLMNQLVFECGYSTAALRERLYISSHQQAPMAGVLIYTAAGDSDGTMGGLVRMGQPGYLEPVIRKALAEAQWCSADPICMEAGERGGQGPESLNLAACHNCALVPETSCEEFNRFLDRGLVVGFSGKPSNGYFHGFTEEPTTGGVGVS